MSIKDNFLTEISQKVSREIYPKDNMYSGNLDAYLKIGMTALRCAYPILQAAVQDKPKSILVLPCGGGRETRWFKAAYPDASLYVSDIDYELTEWTARTFDGIAIQSSISPSIAFSNLNNAYADGFAMIWVGSLITHLPEHLSLDWIKVLFNVLEEGGVLMITSAGEFVKNRFEHEKNNLSTEVLQSYYASGEVYGFAPYKTANKKFPEKYDWMNQCVDSYGQTLINKKWFHNILNNLGSNAHLTHEIEKCYGDRQDIFAFIKATSD